MPPSWSNRWLRLAFRLPVYLYRWRIGWLLGGRIALVTHRGRKSGRVRQTALEVVRYDPETRELVVVSGYGSRADWYRNLRAAPALEVQVGRDRYAPTQRFLEVAENDRELRDYQRRYPFVSRLVLPALSRLLGQPYDGSAASWSALADALRMVAFRPR